jgi:hypothetical protein
MLLFNVASGRIIFLADRGKMNAADFTSIEEALRLRLPEWYRTTLEVYPFPKEEMELFARAQKVINQNQEYRKTGWFGFPWPPSFFIIGEDGCGNLYFLDLADDDPRIFIADHDGGPEPKKEALEEMVSSASLDAHIKETLEIQEKAVASVAVKEGPYHVRQPHSHTVALAGWRPFRESSANAGSEESLPS